MSSSASAVSPARLAANRANAQHSTGPVTMAGKKRSSVNAVKTGLTGRTVLVHYNDAERYLQHIADYEKEYAPVGLRERELVQSLADIGWRLGSIPALEMAHYGWGRTEFASTQPHHPVAERDAICDLQTYWKYEKQLRNLALQENRLRRHRAKDLAELEGLQSARREREEEEQRRESTQSRRSPLAHQAAAAGASGGTTRPADTSAQANTAHCPSHADGFVFSTSKNDPNAAFDRNESPLWPGDSDAPNTLPDPA